MPNQREGGWKSCNSDVFLICSGVSRLPFSVNPEALVGALIATPQPGKHLAGECNYPRSKENSHSLVCRSPPQTLGHILSGEAAASRRGGQGSQRGPTRSRLPRSEPPIPPHSPSPISWPTVDTPQTCSNCVKTEP